MKNAICEVLVQSKGLIYQRAGGKPVAVGWPVFEVDGKPTRASGLKWTAAGEEALANGATEFRHSAAVRKGIMLHLVIRIAPDSPIVRFHYELSAQAGAKLTKSHSADVITYATIPLAKCPKVTEVRLSEWVEVHHSYELNEVPIGDKAFENEQWLMGPILVGEGKRDALVFAYEHGSTVPDAFISFALAKDRHVAVKAVNGNYVANQPADGFATVWFLLGSVEGTLNDLAPAFRQFLLKGQAINPESRKPHVFYNTWNYQERNKHWHGKPYLHEMNQERMLKEIEAAHRTGIDVFVIDTGWFKRTGDWRVNQERFPDGLKAIREKLYGYGMKLGLWFDNSAGTESDVSKAHADCRCSSGGKVWDASMIWET